ncbi:sigma-70 family RNA polymerase sigma factor [Patescibacteria group bacterium]
MDLSHAPYKTFTVFLENLFKFEHDAWRVLNKQYGTILLIYFKNRGIDEMHACDTIQQVYEILFCGIKNTEKELKFGKPEELLNYLKKIANELIRQEFRNSFLKTSFNDNVIENSTTLAEATADSMLVDDDLAESYFKVVREVVADLTNPRYNKVAQLYFIDHFSVSEIQVKTQIKDRDIKRILQRTRKRIAVRLVQEVNNKKQK